MLINALNFVLLTYLYSTNFPRVFNHPILSLLDGTSSPPELEMGYDYNYSHCLKPSMERGTLEEIASDQVQATAFRDNILSENRHHARNIIVKNSGANSSTRISGSTYNTSKVRDNRFVSTNT